MPRRDDEDDRPKKRRPRDEDEEDDDRPKKRRARDEDEDDPADEVDDRPSRRREREEEEEYEDDRPRKKKKKKKTAMPGILIAAAVISLIWGGLALLNNCYSLTTNIRGLIDMQRAQQQLGGVVFQMGGLSQGFYVTLIATQLFTLVASLALIGGGVLLLLGKRLGRPIALGGSLGRIAVNILGVVVGLIVSGGGFFALILIGFAIAMVFDIGVSICLFIMLGNDRAIKALQ